MAVRLKLHISQETMDRIGAAGKNIEVALKRFSETEGRKIMEGLHQDYDRLLFESLFREHKRSRHVRILPDHPPYMGGGIITTLHAGKKRKHS